MLKSPELRKYILGVSIFVILSIAVLGCAQQEPTPQTIIPITQAAESVCGTDVPVGQFVGKTYRDGDDLQVFGCMNAASHPIGLGITYVLYSPSGEIGVHKTGAVVMDDGYAWWVIYDYFNDPAHEGYMLENVTATNEVGGVETQVSCIIDFFRIR